ncbi:hypothetical protein DE146DRAFT_165928 [Phaeosphaeria sp. MPI-PUGE-AT-0046c]|nr:hypothetical protein DE146DRAFT_165928 [Phaeosphaeria sp. MPI-PUGE-AT-0046c]
MPSQKQTIDVEMADTRLDHPLFDESIEAIEHTLLDVHREAFDHVNVSSLLDDLRGISNQSSTDDRIAIACSRKFTLFVRTFSPYFDILSICTKIRPEWIGCFWALIRLLFQVASNYVLFLEKVANMFEVMASVLPPYHQIYNICKRRVDSSHADADDQRLATLMSYAYADIVRMCLDIYRVFLRSSYGLPSRHVAWRPLDSRFAQLEGRLGRHRKWLEKETESHLQDFAEVQQHRNQYVQYLHRRTAASSPVDGELEETRLAKRLRRIESVRSWLSGSSQHEHADAAYRANRANSCNWFLELAQYRRWKNTEFIEERANDASVLQDDWHDRVLFVQAEAGFGKTVLASAVIDDLSAAADEPERSESPVSTAYCFINANISDSIHPDNVFRELATQLLQMHRQNHATLDAACLLLRKTSFQDTATMNDVLDTLALLLRQHPTYIVIDGLDESSDCKSLLSSLAELCRTTDTRAIIFSRPAITIPLEYQKWASDAPHIIPLDAQHNNNAIENFVSQALHRMADQGFFGISMDRTLILDVAHRSRGVFLWARLLLNYLQSPSLSPDERQAILQNVQSLHGLGPLYQSIFRVLGRRPAHEKRVVADVFRWLAFPVHRLCTSALRTALTSTGDMAEMGEMYPADILQALPQFSCGLVDTSHDRVAFVHSSVREFLQSPASRGSEFSLSDESSVHANLATRCINYLAHDVPKRPLGGLSPHIRPMMPNAPNSSGASYRTSKSGDSGYKSLSSSDGDQVLPHPAMQPYHNGASTSSIRTVPFDTNLPFLRYASLCWPVHLSRALSPIHNDHPYVISCPGSLEAVPYVPALSSFLSSRLAITSWVEASFHYSLPPTLTRLVGPLADLKGEIPPATTEGKELRLVVSALNILSEKLMELKRGYATSLRENPSLIWQIGDTVGDEYWPVWDGSTGMPR